MLSFAFEHLVVRPAAPLGRRPVKVAMDGEIAWLRAPLTFRVAPEPLMMVKPVPRWQLTFSKYLVAFLATVAVVVPSIVLAWLVMQNGAPFQVPVMLRFRNARPSILPSRT